MDIKLGVISFKIEAQKHFIFLVNL